MALSFKLPLLHHLREIGEPLTHCNTSLYHSQPCTPLVCITAANYKRVISRGLSSRRLCFSFVIAETRADHGQDHTCWQVRQIITISSSWPYLCVRLSTSFSTHQPLAIKVITNSPQNVINCSCRGSMNMGHHRV